MRNPHVDDRVRLTKGVPETALAPGQVGVVCSLWSGANRPIYEIEFAGRDDVFRHLLTREQFAIDGEEDDVLIEDVIIRRGTPEPVQ